MNEISKLPRNDVSDFQRELQFEYSLRFTPLGNYREKVWKILTANFFQRLIPENGSVLDLGCGWGEFINSIRSPTRFGMDLNPDTLDRLDPAVAFVCADCSDAWPLDNESLDVVFTSNFLEHLPDKDRLKSTLAQAYRCLRTGGKIICMGPNIRYTGGAYWDFWDHYLPLTELSLSEVLTISGFRVTDCVPRFLPYSMVRQKQMPLWVLKVYLKAPVFWRFIGSQFLVVAEKPEAAC
jgi:SAM-dependent methyltransferase